MISLRITVGSLGGRAAVYADSDRRPSMFVSAQPQQHRLELPSRCTGHYSATDSGVRADCSLFASPS